MEESNNSEQPKKKFYRVGGSQKAYHSIDRYVEASNPEEARNKARDNYIREVDHGADDWSKIEFDSVQEVSENIAKG